MSRITVLAPAPVACALVELEIGGIHVLQDCHATALVRSLNSKLSLNSFIVCDPISPD